MLSGDDASRTPALERYERATDLVLLVLALAIIPLLILPLTLHLSPAVDDAFVAADWSVWAVFAVDICVRLYLAERRLHYLRANWFDVLIVALPFLRPLRIVRSARALRLLRLSRAGSYGTRFVVTAREILQQHGLAYVLAVATFLLVGSATLVYVFERDSGGPIRNYGTALWWAVSTITTVGYGDAFPVTNEGRGVAVFLMIVGVSLFGFITANIAAFLVSHDKDSSGTTLDDIASKLETLEDELRALRRQVSGDSAIRSDEAITSAEGRT